MGVLKTSCVALTVLIFPAQAPPLRAMDTAERQLYGFAICAGRLSALMEFQWLLSDPASDQTEAERALMVDILEAMMPAGRGADVLGWRIEAKMAHAALLTRANFNGDAKDAAWAERAARAMTDRCRAFLLS